MTEVDGRGAETRVRLLERMASKGNDVERGIDNGLSNPSGGIKSGWTVPLVMSALLVTLGSFNFGYNISVINAPSAIFLECSPDQIAISCFPVNESIWGFVVSMLCIGALVGSLTTGTLANRFGRRACLIALNGPYIFGSLVMALAMRPWMLLLGRFVIGLGVGASCIVVPMFLSEMSQVDKRGQLTSAHQLMICVGLMFAEMIALGGLAQGGWWRLMFGLSAIPASISLLGMLLYVPESPRFLAQQGQADAASQSLRFFRQHGYEADELAGMLEDSSKADQQNTETWGFVRLMRSWSIAGRSLSVAVLLHLAQQLSGINVVFYFSSILFATPGKSSTTVSTIPAAISMLNLVMTIISIWLVERAGRRPLALGSAFGMVLAGATFTTAYILNWRTISIIAILAYVASFAVGMGPIPWLMMNELFPTQAIAAAVSLDVARFKYPSYWCKADLLWQAMQPIDEDTGLSRGYCMLSKPAVPRLNFN